MKSTRRPLCSRIPTGISWSSLGGLKGVKPPEAFGERPRDWSLGHAGWVRSLGGEDPLEKEMATHSSILAWKIPWTEESGGLQSVGPKESDTTE